MGGMVAQRLNIPLKTESKNKPRVKKKKKKKKKKKLYQKPKTSLGFIYYPPGSTVKVAAYQEAIFVHRG